MMLTLMYVLYAVPVVALIVRMVTHAR